MANKEQKERSPQEVRQEAASARDMALSRENVRKNIEKELGHFDRLGEKLHRAQDNLNRATAALERVEHLAQLETNNDYSE
tara:strand:+ start:306 stop:548 length:243 start_codon:yes stop_codon:yes gene_type:complete